MDRMKTAFEKAMERADQIEKPDDRQRLRWKLEPEGQRLAGDYLRGKGDPLTRISMVPLEHKPYIVKAMVEALVANIVLPRSEGAKHTNTRVVEGIEKLLHDKNETKELLERARYVLEQYWQFGLPQREQSYQTLKSQMEQQVAEVLRRQAGGPSPMQVNVETMPEFQQQWMRVSAEIDQQYQQHIEEFKARLQEVT